LTKTHAKQPFDETGGEHIRFIAGLSRNSCFCHFP
jgi:hypothetical protein